MWLEINNDIIVGVHSNRCENESQWIEYDGEAKPGDRWQNDRVVEQADEVDEVVQKRIAARAKITEHYPEWNQLNILREDNERQIARMGRFIDACRAWSNRADSSFAELERIRL